MRMKMVCDERTLREVANEFSRSEKGAESPGENSERLQKSTSTNSLDVDVLKVEILEYFANFPKTSPARFNHPLASM